MLDTNVLISGLFRRGVPFQLMELARNGRFRAITSSALLGELEDVLTSPKKQFGLSNDEIRRVRSELESFIESVNPVDLLGILSDPGDDAVLAAAKGGGADHIVSGDPDLLGLVEWNGIETLTPRMFADRLEKHIRAQRTPHRQNVGQPHKIS